MENFSRPQQQEKTSSFDQRDDDFTEKEIRETVVQVRAKYNVAAEETDIAEYTS